MKRLASMRLRILTKGLLAIFGAAVVMTLAAPIPTIFAQDQNRSELVLSNLPPKGSVTYRNLFRLAGKDAKAQVLSFTQSEMWSLHRSRVEAVIRRSADLGVKVTRLGSDWNHVLKVPAAPMAMSTAQESMMQAMKAAKETMNLGIMAAPEAALVEYALMKDAGGKRSGTHPAKIVIPLNDKERITVRRTSVDMRPNGCTWRGEIEGTNEPVALMWWKGGRFSGMFTYRSRMYSLKNMGGEVHAVVETDPGMMPPDHAAMRPQGAPAGSAVDLKQDPLVSRGEGFMMREGNGTRQRTDLKDRQDAFSGLATGGETPLAKNEKRPKVEPLPPAQRRALAARKVTIDLMVLYTKSAVEHYIDFEKDLVALAVEQANEAFAMSGLGHIKLRLVHTEQVPYVESGGQYFDHLYRMVDGMTGFAKVRALRDEKRADIVALVVDDPSGCGLSTRVAADADEAFVVVHHSCAALTYTLAHEIGHILGARHDRSLDQNSSPFPYGHGYVNGAKWRDIMSYPSSCNGCPRLPFWSNPTIKIKGERGGTIDSDNARVILEQAERVSKFR